MVAANTRPAEVTTAPEPTIADDAGVQSRISSRNREISSRL